MTAERSGLPLSATPSRVATPELPGAAFLMNPSNRGGFPGRGSLTIPGMPAVRVRDESRPGRVVSELVLPELPERVTARELIRTRVREEVAKVNADRGAAPHHMLVRPTDAEETLNGYRLRQPRTIDWERQAAIALQAFSQNGFFLLVDGRQVDDLDDDVALTADSEIRFVRLTPLVGG